MADFEKFYEQSTLANTQVVKFDKDTPILEVELNEAQVIQRERLRDIVRTHIGDGYYGKGKLEVWNDPRPDPNLCQPPYVHIENEFFTVDGELIIVPLATLLVRAGDEIFLEVWDKEATYTDTLKEHGYEESPFIVPNKIKDPRPNKETTRRIITCYRLVKEKSNLPTRRYLKLGDVISHGRLAKGCFEQLELVLTIPNIQDRGKFVKIVGDTMTGTLVTPQVTSLGQAIRGVYNNWATGVGEEVEGVYILQVENERPYEGDDFPNQYTILEIKAPTHHPTEATLTLMRKDKDGPSDFLDYYLMNYEGHSTSGIRIQSRGKDLPDFNIEFNAGSGVISVVKITPTTVTIPIDLNVNGNTNIGGNQKIAGNSEIGGRLFVQGKEVFGGGSGGGGGAIAIGAIDYVNKQGVKLLQGWNLAEWTKPYGNVPLALDTVNKRHSPNGIKLTIDTADGSGAMRTILTKPLQIHQYRSLRMWVYVENAKNTGEMEIYFTSDDKFTSFLSKVYYENNLVEGWNELLISINSLSNTGAEELKKRKIAFQIRLASTTGPCSITFDSLWTDKKATAKCILTFDDGWTSQYTKAFPMLVERGMLGNMAVVPTWVDKNVDPTYGNVMNLDQMKEMYSYGWDLINHTYTHKNLNNIDINLVEGEVSNCNTWLTNNGFTRGVGILAFPYGGFNEQVITKIAPHLKYARTLVEGTESDLPINPLRCKVRNLLRDMQINRIEGYIDETIQTNGTLVLLNHIIDDNPPEGDNMYFSTEKFSQVLDILYDKRDAIEVITISQWLNDSLGKV